MRAPAIRRSSAILVGLAIMLTACGGEPVATPTDPATVGPTPATSAPSTAGNPPACLDAKLVWADALGRLLLTNCIDQFDMSSVETVWAWDGSVWELLSDDGPPGHVVTGMAWDPDRDILVRYGGIPLPDQECSTETWEWDMTDWRQVDAAPPDPCDHIELAWDTLTGRVLLVGGGRAQDLMPGTFAWDGATWSALADAGPAPRAHHGFITDESDRRVLLYGGLDTSHMFDDLWTWDGSAWAQLPVEGEGPGLRSHHGFAAGGDGALLFGGATSTSTFGSLVDDTWLLAGGGWSQVSGPGPSARGLPALGYDPDRDIFVLHGGFDADGNALADTWEWDGGWSCVAGC